MKKLLYFLCLVLSPPVIFAQNPAVSAVNTLSDYPVNLATGAPSISVPIYQMPTRSDEVSLDLTMYYHPSAASEYNKSLGNAGRGWILSTGGAISRFIIGTADETVFPTQTTGDDVYYFNFPGYSGKFLVSKTSSNALSASIIENSGDPVSIVLELIPGTYRISAINIFDSKGFKFRFADVETKGSGQTISVGFQLTEIIDNNNKQLASFLYNTYTNSVNTYKIIYRIITPGYGKIDLNASFDIGNNIVRTDNITISNSITGSAAVKLYSFIYDYTDPDYPLLTQLDESDSNVSNVQSYKFYYRTNPLTPSQLNGVDNWGYQTLLRPGCSVAATNPAMTSLGTLQKMILPTGGSVIYDFESNTYSYAGGNLIDQQKYNSLIDPNNVHNVTSSGLGSKTFSSGNSTALTFTVPQNNTTVYFSFSGELYDSGLDNLDGSPIMSYPVFTVKQGSTTLFTSTYPYNMGDNGCKGKSLTLNQGTYTITMSPTNLTTGTAGVTQYSLNSTVKKWFNGGGVRIRKIGFFDETDAPQNYYSNAGTFSPERELTYTYNSPTDSSVSSGSLYVNMGTNNASVTYQYVKVFDTQSNSYTEHKFVSPIDNPGDDLSFDYRVGFPIYKKVYDSSSALKAVTDYTFTSENFLVYHNPTDGFGFTTGWIRPSQTTFTQFFNTGNFVKSTAYEYSIMRLLTSVTENAPEGSRITKFYYHSGNSPYSQNRIAVVEKVETYLDATLLSTSKTDYNNSWSMGGTVINQSYLPQVQKASKASAALETFAKINLYDEYSHPIEIEQENGIKKLLIWGYNGTVVIAEIENASYASLSSTVLNLIASAQGYSNTVNQSTLASDTANLESTLNQIRTALPASSVTTYIHIPLVGIASKTDARGYKLTYQYDVANRLISIKDANGNKITEKEYNIKPN